MHVVFVSYGVPSVNKPRLIGLLVHEFDSNNIRGVYRVQSVVVNFRISDANCFHEFCEHQLRKDQLEQNSEHKITLTL